MQVSPVGLKNFGNTCFLNAVSHCLAVADDRDWEAVARKAFGGGQWYGKSICEQTSCGYEEKTKVLSYPLSTAERYREKVSLI